MRAAGAEVGWSFARLGVPDPVLAANVRWLSRYLHDRCAGSGDVAARLVEVFAEPRGLFGGAELAGERIGVLPVLYHLLWRQVLAADLRCGPLNAATVVSVAAGGERAAAARNAEPGRPGALRRCHAHGDRVCRAGGPAGRC